MPTAASRDIRTHRPPLEAGSTFARMAAWYQQRASGPVTSEAFAPDASFITALRRQSVLGRISTPTPPMIRLALQTEAPTALWVPEGGLKSASAPAFVPALLKPKKVSALTTMTAEAARTPGAASAFRAAASAAALTALDAAVVDGLPEDAARPAGLLHGLSIHPAATAAEALDLVLADLLAVAEPGSIALVGQPGTLAAAVGSGLYSQGRADFPALVSTAALPAGRLVGTAVPLVLSTFDRLEFGVSSQAVVTIDGTPRSLWSENLIGVLVEGWATWLAAPGAVSAADVG